MSDNLPPSSTPEPPVFSGNNISENKKDISLNTKTLFLGILFVALVTLAGVFFWSLGKKSALDKYRAEFSAYQDTTVKPILKLVDSLQKKSDSIQTIADDLKKKSESQTTELINLRNTNIVLRTTNSKLVDSLNTLILPPECDFCKQVANQLTAENDSLTKEIGLLHQRDSVRVNENISLRQVILLEQQSNDSLRKVIINFPKPPRSPKIFGIELSNRTVFVAGIIIGGIAVGSVK